MRNSKWFDSLDEVYVALVMLTLVVGVAVEIYQACTN